jgi:hypothetical protein
LRFNEIKAVNLCLQDLEIIFNKHGTSCKDFDLALTNDINAVEYSIEEQKE